GGRGRRVAVVEVVGAAVVLVVGGDPAQLVGVHPHDVLAVGAGVALGRQLGDGVGEAVIAGRRQDHVEDGRLAGGVGDPADVADAARLAGRVVENGVGLRRPLPDEGHDRVVLVGMVRRPGVDGLDPVAVLAVTEAVGVGIGGGRGPGRDVLVGQDHPGPGRAGLEAVVDVDALR